MRWLARLVFVALLVLGTLAVFFRTPDTDPEAMVAKYTNASSQFAENGAGLRVHFRDEGNPDAQPIIFVHGGGASLHVWEGLVEQLGDKYRLVSLTLPGHGLSGPRPDEDYSFEGMAQAVDLVAQTLSIERFAIVGSSLGGWVAWRYALAHPDKVDALVLLAAIGTFPPEGEELPPEPFFFTMQMSAMGRMVIANFLPRGLIEAAGQDATYDDAAVSDEAVDRFWELMRYPGNRMAPSTLPQDVYWDPQYDARLPDIAAPTLIIWGRNDTFVPLNQGEELARNIPNADLLIYEETGHVPMEERPEETARDIDAFLADIASDQG